MSPAPTKAASKLHSAHTPHNDNLKSARTATWNYLCFVSALDSRCSTKQRVSIERTAARSTPRLHNLSSTRYLMAVASIGLPPAPSLTTSPRSLRGSIQPVRHPSCSWVSSLAYLSLGGCRRRCDHPLAQPKSLCRDTALEDLFKRGRQLRSTRERPQCGEGRSGSGTARARSVEVRARYGESKCTAKWRT